MLSSAQSLSMINSLRIGILVRLLIWGLCAEESPDDLQINHQIRVEAHLVA